MKQSLENSLNRFLSHRIGIFEYIIFVALFLIFFSLANGTQESFVPKYCGLFCMFVLAFFEELIFRKFLYGFLRKRKNSIIAAIFSSVIFSIAHTQYYSSPLLLFNIFIFGIKYCVIFDYTNSLLFTSLMHFLENVFRQKIPEQFFHIISVYYPNSAVVSFVSFFLVLYFYHKKNLTLPIQKEERKKLSFLDFLQWCYLQSQHFLIVLSIPFLYGYDLKKEELFIEPKYTNIQTYVSILFILTASSIFTFYFSEKFKNFFSVFIAYTYTTFWYIFLNFFLNMKEKNTINFAILYVFLYVYLRKQRIIPKLEYAITSSLSIVLIFIEIVLKTNLSVTLLSIAILVIILLRENGLLYNFLAFTISSLISRFSGDEFQIFYAYFWVIYSSMLAFIFSLKYLKLFSQATVSQDAS